MKSKNKVKLKTTVRKQSTNKIRKHYDEKVEEVTRKLEMKCNKI
jgi:hypothetical protein